MRYSRNLRARQPGGRRTLTQQLLSALSRYPGSSLYVHGAGVVSGIQAGNWLFSNATTAATVDNPVGRIDDVRGGVPMLQDTTQKKVTLRRGLVNLLTNSHDLRPIGATGWTATAGITKTENSITEGAGSLTRHGVFRDTAGVVGETRTTVARIANKTGNRFFRLVINAVTTGNFVYMTVDPVTNTITQAPKQVGAGMTLVQGSIATHASGDLIVSLTAAGSIRYPTFTLSNVATPPDNAADFGHIAYTGDGVSGLFINGAGQFGGTVTAQQIIDAGGIPITTTAPASSASGPWAHQFDGADDSFGTTLTPGNAGFVCVGANFYDNALRTVLGAGAGATTGDAGVWLSRNAGNLTLYTSDGASRQSVSAAYPIGTNAVASAGWSADSMLVGANNTEATAAKTLNCATAAKQMAIGMMTAAGSTAGMLGTLGGAMIIVPALPSPSDRALMRRWVGNLYGVQL